MQKKDSTQRLLLNPASLSPEESIFAGLVLDDLYRKGKKSFQPNELYDVDDSIWTDDVPVKVKSLFGNVSQVQFSVTLTAAENSSSMTGVAYYLHDYSIKKFRNSLFQNVAGVLKPQANGELKYISHKERIAKCWRSNEDEARNENELTRRHRLMGAKPLSSMQAKIKKTQASESSVDMHVMVMRKLPGSDLLPYLLREQQGETVFTLDQRLQLSRQLMRALIEQVQMNNIIHRDISAHNIRIDISQPHIPVTIFDFGMSVDKSVTQHPDTVYGTPIYMSPEVYDMKPAKFPADIYSIAWILAMLWRADEHPVEALYRRQQTKVVKTYKLYEQQRKLNECLVKTAHKCKFKNFFKGISGLSFSHKRKIANMIQSMVNLNPALRPNAGDVYACFDDVVSERRVKKLPKNQRPAATLAHRQGKMLRDELEYREWQDDDTHMLQQAITQIKQSLSVVQDDSAIIAELLEAAKLMFLSGLKTKSAVTDALDSLQRDFCFLKDAFEEIKEKSEEMLKQIDGTQPLNFQNQTKHIAKRVATVQQKYGEPRNLREVVAGLPKLQKHVAKLTVDIDQACSMKVTGPSFNKLTSM